MIRLAASEARNSTALATSPTCPMRAIGVSASQPGSSAWRRGLAGDHRGLDVGGGDGVDADALRRPFDGEAAGEVVDRGLGDVVGGLRLRPVDDGAGHRAEVHDRAAPPVEHVAAEGAGAPEDAVDVDVHRAEPGVVGDFGRSDAGLADAGVVDEDGRRAAAGGELSAIPVMRAASVTSPNSELGLVAFGGERGAALGADRLVALDDDDAGAGLGQRLGAGEADAAAAAGDDGELGRRA